MIKNCYRRMTFMLLIVLLLGFGQSIILERKSKMFADQKSLDNGLVGYWKLHGDCKDYSGNGNHGVNHGVDLYYSAFNGRDNYVEIHNSECLNFGTGDFSISVWIFLEYFPGCPLLQ